MGREKDKDNKNAEKKKVGHRERVDQPVALPGIRRIQFFSDLSDRPWTKNLNRAAMFGIASAFLADFLKPVMRGVPQTTYCYECRACYATQDKCPASITFQAELTVASRVSDYERFIRNGGLACVRCGNCVSFCVINLNLPRIYARMQELTIQAMEQGKIPRKVLLWAYENGRINRLWIDRVARYLGKA